MGGTYRQEGDYLLPHPFNSGDSDCATVLDQLYQAYADSHESDPQEIRDAFAQLGDLLEDLPLVDNDMLFGLICRLCIAYDQKAYRDGLQYGAHLMSELFWKEA